MAVFGLIEREKLDFLWRNKRSTRIVESKLDDYIISPEDSGKMFNNYGATSAVDFALPPQGDGLHFYFTEMTGSQTITVTPHGLETIRYQGSTGGTGDPLTSATGYVRCHIVGVDGTWVEVTSGSSWSL